MWTGITALKLTQEFFTPTEISRKKRTNHCAPVIEELTLISAEENLRPFSKENFYKYCNHPKTDEEIAETVLIYTKLELPGCVGSADYVHIR
jgi:hypothetical protein